jgi:hypothetical protein
MRTFRARRVLAAGLALAAVLTGFGCHSLATQPTKTAATMSGEWRVDEASSDDFDRKLAPLLEQERRHALPRQAAPSPSAAVAAAVEIDPLVMPAEEPGKLRARLADDLRPAARLRIALVGEGVEITRDAEPVREFLPGQSVSRIDSSGAASIVSGWDQSAFVIRARYTNKATRSWRLQHDPASDTLQVTFEASNSEFGHLSLRTLYRRAP